MFTDASAFALGAILCQHNKEGELCFVSLASRTLKAAEFNYFTIELELLAIVWTLQKFRSFVLGSYIIINTDHKALPFLLSSKHLNGRLMRWLLVVQDYRLQIKHKGTAQFYSRCIK